MSLDGHVVLHKEHAERERRKMTVCIAAACDFAATEPKVILCSDTQLSGSLGSTQALHKQFVLAPGWFAAFSGAPDAARDLFIRMRRKFLFMKVEDENTVLSLVREAMNERKKMLSDEYVNSKFAMSYDDFLKSGKAQLAESRHLAAAQAIETMPIGADFLVVGFVLGYPLIIETNQQCRAAIRDAFAAIGDGGYLAHASLLHREHSEIHLFNKAVYHVYEAKKWAQRNRSVGDATHMIILHMDGSVDGLGSVGAESLDKIFTIYGPKDLPDTLGDLPTNSFQTGILD
jgi:hypothetical protein